MKLQQATILFFCALLVFLTGCSRNTVGLPSAPAAALPDNSYQDLQAGSTLKIVLPMLKPGALRSTVRVQETNGNTISVASDDVIGYSTSKYAVTGKSGVVSLQLISAQQTQNGQTLVVADPPRLPFQLPRKREHVRLIYLVRVSQADHNMAIVGSKRLDSLNVYTARLKKDPTLCKTTGEVFCSWVPAGVAVRPE
jgi:hypothetical protein